MRPIRGPARLCQRATEALRHPRRAHGPPFQVVAGRVPPIATASPRAGDPILTTIRVPSHAAPIPCAPAPRAPRAEAQVASPPLHWLVLPYRISPPWPEARLPP